MRVAIMQPYFMPYIGYWQMIGAVDQYVIYDDVNFIKGGWINRNRILVGGDVKYFNISLKEASQNKLINQVEILNDPKIIGKKLRTIKAAYSKAPFFKDVYELLEKILVYNEINLASFLINSLEVICGYLNIRTPMLRSSEIFTNQCLHGETRIIDICKKLGATQYYNAIGGVDLYSLKNFAQYNIDLKFLQTLELTYDQMAHVFIPNLSIIDVMMFNSKEEIAKMLKMYKITRGGGIT